MSKNETCNIGKGIFIIGNEPIKSKYASYQIKKNNHNESFFKVLEEEATTEITNSVHGMCRDQILINNLEDFLQIVQELNPKKYNYYLTRAKAINCYKKDDRFDYKFKDFINLIRRLATFEFIMTENILFFEDIPTQGREEFCIKREIDILPSRDNIHLWRLSSGKFIKQKIIDKDKLKINDYLFDKEIMEKFEETSPIKFIFKDNLIVGIVHFSDYNRKPVSVYLYGLISELEKKIREFFIKSNYSEERLLNYLKTKGEKMYDEAKRIYDIESDKLYPFQAMTLRQTGFFYNHLIKENALGLIKIDETIFNLRNDVAHGKNLIKLKNSKLDSEKYLLDSFYSLRDTIIKLSQLLT